MTAPISGPRPLLPQPGYELEQDEVEELWSFVHGDIMMGGLRQQLRSHLGLCDRHAWGHAVVEIELWEFGPGKSGGHQPFDVAVLHEDLLGRVSQSLATYRPSRRHPPEDVLGRHGTCRICAEIAGDTANVIGYAAQDAAPLVLEANRMTHTHAWVTSSTHLWLPRVCPACLPPGSSPEAPDAGASSLCRWHLLGRHDLDAATSQTYASHLTQLRDRLTRHLTSMTDSGSASTPEDRVAWIEALGWFAGWSLPLTLRATRAEAENHTAAG